MRVDLLAFTIDKTFWQVRGVDATREELIEVVINRLIIFNCMVSVIDVEDLLLHKESPSAPIGPLQPDDTG